MWVNDRIFAYVDHPHKNCYPLNFKEKRCGSGCLKNIEKSRKNTKYIQEVRKRVN